MAEHGERRFSTLDVVREGAIDWLTLNRPERLNAMTATMIRELNEYFRDRRDDTECRVIMLRGAGRGFCAGLDIKEVVAGGDGLPATDQRDTLEPGLHEVVRGMRACPQPIVVLLHGAAVGGGFGLLLAADIRIASDEARMSTGFTKVGTSGCEMGVTYFLPRIVGMGVALELMYTSRFIDARRALEVGLVTAVVSKDALESTARALAADMLNASYLGLRRTKETFNRCLRITDLDAVLDLEERVQMRLAGIEHMDRLRAFADKR